jgi:hypothetical protein
MEVCPAGPGLGNLHSLKSRTSRKNVPTQKFQKPGASPLGIRRRISYQRSSLKRFQSSSRWRPPGLHMGGPGHTRCCTYSVTQRYRKESVLRSPEGRRIQRTSFAHFSKHQSSSGEEERSPRPGSRVTADDESKEVAAQRREERDQSRAQDPSTRSRREHAAQDSQTSALSHLRESVQNEQKCR